MAHTGDTRGPRGIMSEDWKRGIILFLYKGKGSRKNK